MCGRFIVEDSDDEIGRILSTASERFGDTFAVGEVFPSNPAIVLTASSASGMRVGVATWGWNLPGKSKRIINTRRETLTSSSFYRNVSYIHCVIPASCYLEWDRNGKRYRFTRGGTVWMAALLDCSRPGGDCFTILTGNAVGECMDIHDRMPLLLQRSELREWLCGNAGVFLTSDIPMPEIIEDFI